MSDTPRTDAIAKDMLHTLEACKSADDFKEAVKNCFSLTISHSKQIERELAEAKDTIHSLGNSEWFKLECLRKAEADRDRLQRELTEALNKLAHEQESNWTASLCDRVNEFLREHPVHHEVTTGEGCSKAVTVLHGYAGSLNNDRDRWKEMAEEACSLIKKMDDDLKDNLPEYERLEGVAETLSRFAITKSCHIIKSAWVP